MGKKNFSLSTTHVFPGLPGVLAGMNWAALWMRSVSNPSSSALGDTPKRLSASARLGAFAVGKEHGGDDKPDAG